MRVPFRSTGSVLAADGGAHPDFTGMWLGASGIGQSTTARKSTNWPKPAPLTEAGQKAYAAYDAKKDDPPEDCMPWGLPRNEVFTFYPMLLTRTSNMLLMTLEYEPVPRRIYLDGRDYPTDIPPQWYGYRSEEHTSELQSLMRISYAVFCLKKKKQYNTIL